MYVCMYVIYIYSLLFLYWYFSLGKKFSISIEDISEFGSVTQSGHHQVNVSGVTAGGNVTIQLSGQGMSYYYYTRHTLYLVWS